MFLFAKKKDADALRFGFEKLENFFFEAIEHRMKAMEENILALSVEVAVLKKQRPPPANKPKTKINEEEVTVD